jgi:hypothetical protein
MDVPTLLIVTGSWYNQHMASKITPEQKADLQAHQGRAVPVQDDNGNVVCYMIDVQAFRGLQYEQRLQELLEEGDNSPDVSAEEAARLVRQHTQELTDRYA